MRRLLLIVMVLAFNDQVIARADLFSKEEGARLGAGIAAGIIDQAIENSNTKKAEEKKKEQMEATQQKQVEGQKKVDEKPETNETVKRLKSCAVGVVVSGAFNEFGTTLWGLIVESSFYTTGDGQHIDSDIRIDGNLVELILIRPNGVISFNFIINGNIAMLNGGYMRVENIANQAMNAEEATAMLMAVRQASGISRPSQEDMKKAELRARKLVGAI